MVKCSTQFQSRAKSKFMPISKRSKRKIIQNVFVYGDFCFDFIN